MLELNKVLLTGRLTRDPEYRSTTTGRAVARFTLAVNRRWYNRETGSQQEETTFVDVDVWERSAEFVKNYLRKGSGVFVEGRLKQDNWQDKETGQNRSKLGIVAERVQFAESRAEAERSSGGSGLSAPPVSRVSEPEPEPRYDSADSSEDDLPF